MRSIADHQAAVRAALDGLADRPPEVWSGALPPLSSQPRVLAADIIAPIDLPPFDNSQMDGYAVRAREVGTGATLAVAKRIPAGAAVGSLAAGTAAPIMTGAPIPVGADAVIPIEDSQPDEFQPDDGERSVSFSDGVQPGTFVRMRGSDLSAGSLLLAAGTRLGPAQWGVLAASGVREVPLLRRVRVLVLSTGDELVAGDTALGGGKIHDANSSSLAVALAGAGAEVVASRVVADDAAAMRVVLAEYAPRVDLILTTGGVSQGAYEVVRDVFEGVGVEFVSVAIQPAGPQGIGVASIGDQRLPVVAFPGNPVSALVSFELFLRPALRALHGLSPDRPVSNGRLTTSLESPAAKHQVRRGRLNEAGGVELIGGASSHLIHGYAASRILIHVPVGVSHLDAGESVTVWSIDD
jgi:molybdopterin molybdotransferase